MATVTGRIVSSNGAPVAAAKLSVTLRSAYAGPNRAGLSTIEAVAAPDGTFSLDLQGGKYTLGYGQRDSLTFVVPLDSDTHNITDLLV